MPDLTNTFLQERAHIELALTHLRPHFSPGTPDSEILSAVLRNGTECTPTTVEEYAKTHKRFSTSGVMQHFHVGKYKVAGAVAALRRQSKIEPDEPAEDSNGYSRWKWVG